MVLEASPSKDAELRTSFSKSRRFHKRGFTFDTGVFEELSIKSNLDFWMFKNLAFLKGYKTEGESSPVTLLRPF